MASLIHLVRPQSFREEVIAEKKIVLFFCMAHDDAFHQQLQVVEEIAKLFEQELKVVLPEEDSIEVFKEDFAIVGGPTFLILEKGREVARTIGLADLQSLRKFVSKALQSIHI